MTDPAPGMPATVTMRPSFPPGLEHLDSTALQPGFEDRGQYAILKQTVEKSPNDNKEYVVIRLKNGLECIVVRDPEANQPAASLTVRTGHLDDPVDAPGLAHFCEHLLFQGTAKYPQENSYNEFLAAHNGFSNAWTASGLTCYYFAVGESGFAQALDRFAQFFVHPLFKADCVDREVKAVNSEYEKNLKDDGWRIQELGRSLAKAPYNKFAIGNIETLDPKSRDVRAELIKFYESHYSANIMKLCIVSKAPVNDSIALAVGLFSEVQDRRLAPSVYPMEMYDSSRFMTQTFIKTVRDSKGLDIEFAFPDQSRLAGTRTGKLLADVINHEGRGSLYDFLRGKGLVSEVGAHTSSSVRGTSATSFSIYCSLTNEGLKQHRLVAATVFEYLEMLKKQPFPKYLFDEMKENAGRSFRYLSNQDPVDVANELSNTMQMPWPRSQLLSAPYRSGDFDIADIKKALDCLSMEVCQVWVLSQTPVDGLEWQSKERWFRTQYTVRPLTKEWFKSDEATATEKKFAYPGPNPYIPKDLELIGKRGTAAPLKRPLLIKETIGSRVWYKQDDRWKVPKASLIFKLTNPLIRSSLKTKQLTRFYVALANEALESETYDAAVAGLKYGFAGGLDHLQIQVTGYSDKMLVLLHKVVRVMKDLKIDAERLKLKKEAFLQQLDNQAQKEPLKQIRSEWIWLTQQHGHSDAQLRAAIEAVTAEGLQAFVPELLSKFYLEALGHGNLDKTTLYEGINILEEVLSYDRLSRECMHVARQRHLPPGMNEVYKVTASSKDEVNNAIQYMFHFGHPSDDELQIRLLVLGRLLHEPCFDILRTEEQLGYIVGASAMVGTSYMSLQISIQSGYTPDYLEKRIDVFLDKFERILAEKDIENLLKGIITEATEDYKSLGEETKAYWAKINGTYDFFYGERTAGLLRKLTKQDIVDTFMTYIHAKGAKRSKLSIQLYSQQVDSKPIVEMLDKHGVKHEIKGKMLVEDLRKAVEQAGKDLPLSVGLEIMKEIEKLGTRDGISDVELKKLLPLGEPLKPVAQYYDGITSKL